MDEENLWSASKFRILHANIRGWISHMAELAATIRSMMKKPNIVCLNETFLNQAVEHIELEEYKLVARRDRSDGRSGESIVAFANDNVFERATLIATSDTAKRCWLLIHADQALPTLYMVQATNSRRSQHN